jgi:peptidoglycan/xylan/chitin deacetylase (PgdA/CDA1 family)
VLPKQLLQNKLIKKRPLIFLDFVLVAFIAIGGYFLVFKPIDKNTRDLFVQDKSSKETVSNLSPTSTPMPTPTPTPKPLTLAEMNALYGPCVRVPVLMYHHVQSRDSATAKKQTGLTVYTDVFQGQMQYLKDKGYNVISMNELSNFFDAGSAVPVKSVLLTFDDGYQDFYTDAYPILSSLSFKSTVFVPTGLVDNPDYLSWGEISGMNGITLFANHTWSHKNVAGETTVMQKEISTGDSQLAGYGLNNTKVFAYPYGPDSIAAENYLSSIGYKLAFTTRPGNILCKQQRFSLPRIRIGNTPLSNHGF